MNIFNTKYTVVDIAARLVGYKTITKDHNLNPKADYLNAFRA